MKVKVKKVLPPLSKIEPSKIGEGGGVFGKHRKEKEIKEAGPK